VRVVPKEAGSSTTVCATGFDEYQFLSPFRSLFLAW
jgi:hypothetical protein